MALNHRLTIEGSDIKGNNAEVRVYLEGYTGAVVTRPGAPEMFELSYGDSSSELLPLVYGSQATIKFFAFSDYEFLDLFATTAQDVYIEIELTDTNTILFKGFIEPGNWSEPLTAPNYEVSLTAYDGLGLLKDVDFLDPDREYYEGEYTPLEILRLLLSKTGLDLALNTRVNIRPLGADTTADSLSQYKKDLETYRGLNCYEVLEQLFKNTRIFQRLGQWWAISNDNYQQTTFGVFKYLADGSANGTETINTALNGWWFEGKNTLEMMPPLKQFKLVHDYGYDANLVENGNFEDIENGVLDNWTAAGGITYEQRVLNTDGDRYIFLPGSQTPGDWEDDRSQYLQSKAVKIQETTSTLKVKVSAALMGPFDSSAYVFFGVFLYGDNGTKYSAHPYIYEGAEGDEIRYYWLEVATGGKKAIPVSANIGEHGTIFKYTEVDPARTEAKPFDRIDEAFSTKSISIENGIPTTGLVSVVLFLAHSPNGTPAGTCWREIELSFADESNDELATENEIVLINDAKNNFTPADIELLNGDVPAIPNQLVTYNGSFMTIDGEATSTWQLDTDGTAYSYIELMARLLAAQSRTTKQSYNAQLAEVIPTMATVISDAENSNRRFLEAGISYNFRLNRVEGRYIEIKPIILNTFTLSETKEYKSTAGSSSSSSAAAGSSSTDEKAKLINPETFATIGQPGYLSSNYFAQEIDETTGRAATYPTNVKVDTTNFTNLLSPADDTIQKALDTLDTHNHDAAYKAISYTPTWAEITGKPSTYTPTAHNHNDLYYTESEIDSLLAAQDAAINLNTAKRSYPTADETKLDGIEAGAQVNVAETDPIWSSEKTDYYKGDANYFNQINSSDATIVRNKGSVFTTNSNSTGSTNYPTEFGQTWYFSGAEYQRDFALFKRKGYNDLYLGTNETGTQIGDWQKIYHSGNFTDNSTNWDANTIKLTGIETGAEVNVNADWDAVSGDAEILNKPTIPTATDYIENQTASPQTAGFNISGSGTLGGSLTAGGNVNIGAVKSSSTLPLNIFGLRNAPATTGAIPNGVFNYGTSLGPHLYCGGYSAAPYGMWLQASDYTNLAVNYPIVLNPNGGNLLIGTTTDNGAKLQVEGNTTISGDLTAADINASGDIGATDINCVDVYSSYISTGTLKIWSQFYDGSGGSGTNGQVLSSTGTGTKWIDMTGGGGGSVVSVAAGNGMSFGTITTTGSVSLATPLSITASSTNNSGNVGSGHSHALGSNSIMSTHLNSTLISGLGGLYSGLISSDELMISDAGTLRRMDVSVLQDYMQNNLSFSSSPQWQIDTNLYFKISDLNGEIAFSNSTDNSTFNRRMSLTDEGVATSALNIWQTFTPADPADGESTIWRDVSGDLRIKTTEGSTTREGVLIAWADMS